MINMSAPDGRNEERTPLLQSPIDSPTTSTEGNSPATNSNHQSSDQSLRRSSSAGNVRGGTKIKRKPVHYYSINPTEEHKFPQNNDMTEHTAMAVNRYRYYCKLDPHQDSSLVMPDHVVPSYFVMMLPLSEAGSKQNSIVTIFSIWNTMMGTSLLSMPWAIQEAGFGLGLGLILCMAALAFYTAYLISKTPGRAAITDPAMEFYLICRLYIGRWGERLAFIFSLAPLTGGAIVYWVLMSNFLYNVVVYIHDAILGDMIPESLNDTYPGAHCPSMPIDVINNSTLHGLSGSPTLSPGPAGIPTSIFQKVWHATHTVPFFLLLLLGPLINFKSPTFFTKFNTLGTVSVAYLLIFVSYKASQWGIHMDFSATDAINIIPMYRWSFLALTGTCSLALFIHNCLLTILSMQEKPENNGRDLVVAYSLVAGTYILIGVIFYISFPFAKSCIADNLLNNIQNSDIMAFVARLFLLFQMTTVYPLLVYLLRAQFLQAVLGSTDPSLKATLLVNLVIVTVCILFAVFLPNIGVIIRFTGAFCGLAYIFTLPCIIHLLQLRDEERLTWLQLIVHSLIVLLGLGNFIGQFIPV